MTWLKSGTPAHWVLVLCALWVLVSFVLSKIPKVRANTTAEAIFNAVNPIVMPIVRKVPAIGPVLASLLDGLDTPAPAPAIQQPEVK